MNIKKLYLNTKRALKRLILRLQGKEVVHFIHIGKTGGTAVKHTIANGEDPRSNYRVFLNHHAFKLKDVPRGDKYCFFLRDPKSRFISGFYSRQRQGRPRYFWPWSEDEKLVFETFENPNELARALSSEDARIREIAELGMRTIQHVRDSYWDWFHSKEYFLSRIEDLFFVGFQETLAQDFENLKNRLSLKDEASLPQDNVKAHRNPDSIDKKLDAQAEKNLEKWYAKDYEFMNLCREALREIQPVSENVRLV